ncbi:tRNA preQ1(34) S-adenosylmethionine ribosyltransferase-isomerase QueA [Desulfurivibrio alkaliphilus]|uniref:S-adenosylmethionine:tRNA ribosyltransferase-isomerase n=1 Tax=Desulfurivibrio alkaliphilus (strain DSM 19089 / UNIQEM U267 / AHT2) TaxID=589865 RepID=D6Z6L0_DESAT|nr:tRNA preQ1(34) S-adenosylmethionine ribosyltransferase-isomerase QueA [Desulfurivibrio alkaliphilus]ADH84969.1 S-adenosylmethionine/tRNA-ribosyltransferase-isomerase [Desulfurivibrio alkaliphilus AHT 2]
MTAYSLDDYDYHLPPELIAQQPPPRRDGSRLLVCDGRRDFALSDQLFPDMLSWLAPGDLLVFNDTRVFPARLSGHKESGGRVELLLLAYPVLSDVSGPGATEAEAWGLLKSSKGARPGTWLQFGDDLRALVEEKGEGGKVRVRLVLGAPLADCLARYGRMPLPPYIKRENEQEEDRRRYQTIYAQTPGAVAAPTAGLHFTQELLGQIKKKGVGMAHITLHVGYGTFAPVRSQDIRRHQIHAEEYLISRENAELINRTKAAGGRIWAVGTTSVRTLEAAAGEDGRVNPGSGSCRLYIYPGYSFKVVDNLLTNFHLPRSSLLFLVSALAGRENILRAYRHAVAERYRFFSYGDAMAIIRK